MTFTCGNKKLLKRIIYIYTIYLYKYYLFFIKISIVSLTKMKRRNPCEEKCIYNNFVVDETRPRLTNEKKNKRKKNTKSFFIFRIFSHSHTHTLSLYVSVVNYDKFKKNKA